MSQHVASLPAPVSVLLEGLLQIADEGVVIQDADGKIVYCNPAAERILGLPANRIVGANSYHFETATILEDGSPFPADAHPVMRTLRTGMPFSNVVMGIDRGPETACRWLSISSAIVPLQAGEPILAFAIFTDITPHVEAKRQLQKMAQSLQQSNQAISAAESFMRNLLRAMPDQVSLKDPQGVYLYCNKALAETYHSTEAEVIGKTDYHFLAPPQADHFRQHDMETALSEKPLVIEETVSYLENPAPTVIEAVKVPVHDEAGRLIGILGVARDVTERRELQEQLRKSNLELTRLMAELQSLVRTDPLTGLLNRRAFEEAIALEFQRFKQLAPISSLLMIDIDYFKQVNDRYGHDAGDAALLMVADAFRANCRAVDVSARLGGEEFALLLPATGSQEATRIAERLRKEVQRTEIAFGSKRFTLTISLGISSFRQNDERWQQVVSRADEALYAAKASGRNKVCNAKHSTQL